MNYLPNIVIIGKAGAGKSTIADILVRRFGYDKRSFAAPLKVGCNTSTDRELLQRVGHGVRELYPDFWVNLFMDDILRRRSVSHHSGDIAPIVVDDCRYPNELAVLRGEDFKAIWVMATYTERVRRLRANGKLQDESQLEDISETSLDPGVHALKRDYHIWNEGKDTHQLAEQLAVILNMETKS